MDHRYNHEGNQLAQTGSLQSEMGTSPEVTRHHPNPPPSRTRARGGTATSSRPFVARNATVSTQRFTAPFGELYAGVDSRRRSVMDGYDADLFSPAPDPKYECPICLMVARDPTQTECGHRFCNNCIKKWMRDSSTTVKCPVCNDSLVESSLFPDNFAKREILSLTVKCSNYMLGCSWKTELTHLQSHLDTSCPYTKVACPKECAAVVYRRDLQRHIEEDCTHRQTKCKMCFSTISLADQERHLAECPYADQICQFCNKLVLRKEREQHISSECNQAPVRCDFFLFGCEDELARDQLPTHNEACQQKHLHLFAIYFRRLLPTSSLSSAVDCLSSSLAQVNLQHPSTTSSGYGTLGSGTLQSTQGLHHSGPGRSLDDHLLHRLSPVSLTSGQPHSEPLNYGELRYSCGAMGRDDSGVDTLTEKSRGQDARLARHEQQILELQAKISYLEKKVKDQSAKMRHQEEIISELETRCSNGVYFWKIREFSRKSREAKMGTTTVLHSPGFHSSYHGYKMCVRVNLNGVESGHGSHLSVFVHLMRGEFDDMLSWPFTGKITLTIIDQSEAKQHVSETLEGNATIAAFHRPTTSRNHKGFGYMEFAPLSVVENSPFIRNDTMILRCEVEEPS